MALASRRGGNRFASSIWPGFVDVMTALILVLFFVLSIFMIVQFVLRETITGKDRELDALSVQVANLADALGLARSEADTAGGAGRDADRRPRRGGGARSPTSRRRWRGCWRATATSAVR